MAAERAEFCGRLRARAPSASRLARSRPKSYLTILNEMELLHVTRWFLCPVCTQPRAVRMTKKNKPYIVCDPCGVQVFVRGPAGIETFSRLLEQARHEDLLTRFKEMVGRYRLTCPACGGQFWIGPKLIETSVFDGSLKGVRCPEDKCKALLQWEHKS